TKTPTGIRSAAASPSPKRCGRRAKTSGSSSPHRYPRCMRSCRDSKTSRRSLHTASTLSSCSFSTPATSSDQAVACAVSPRTPRSSTSTTTRPTRGLALATMRVEMDGRLAWAKVTRRMLREANAVMAESEGIIDTLNSIAGLELAILFKEVSSDLTKISVRSRGGVDAAALCASFGGGGHIRAAGAEIEKGMEEATKLVLSAAKEAILATSSQR